VVSLTREILLASFCSRPKPRGKLREKMCEKCPFRPDGSGYAQDHEDFPRIVASVEMGLDFWCHETVIFDERTTMDAAGDGPEPPFQEHFEGCRGAHERRMQKWEERALTFILMEKVLVYPSPIRPSAAPHVGRVVGVRFSTAVREGVLVLLEGKRTYVPLERCHEPAPSS